MQTNTPTIQNDPDEIEIDLRKYVEKLRNRWRLLITSMLVASLLGTLFSFVLPAPYEAIASIAIVRTSTQVQFDPKIRTVSQDEALAAQAQTVDSRRATLVSLVQGNGIAEIVRANLLAKDPTLLTADEQQSSTLIEKVKSEAPGRSDLINIKVQDRDPVKAALIANEWASEYERSVNALYVGASAGYVMDVRGEYSRSLEAYNVAQAQLETFIAESKEDELKRDISEIGQFLDALQEGRQNAVTLVISEQLRVNSGIISAYLDAQSANRTLAFEKEQEGRRSILRALLDAVNSSSTETIQTEVNASLASLTLLHNARIRTRQLLLNAQAMRDSIARGGDSAAQSNLPALTVLKLQVFSAAQSTTDSVQINIDNLSVDNANTTAATQLADIDGLIAALRARDIQLTAEIERLALALQNGSAYSLTLTSAADSSLTRIISDTYASLFDLGEIGELSENVPVTNPLTLAAQARARELVRAQIGAIALGSNGNSAQPDAVITQFQARLRQAQAQLEGVDARRKQLTTNRDLARETADSLARKVQEVALSATIAGTEVRVASLASVPTRRVTSRLIPIAASAATGLLIGALLALILDDSGASRFAGRLAPKESTRFGKLTRWILHVQE